jgi:hypothetical protein
VRSTLSSKGNSVSLKKLRKALLKASGGSLSKEEAGQKVIQALMDNAEHVRISWNEESD